MRLKNGASLDGGTQIWVDGALGIDQLTQNFSYTIDRVALGSAESGGLADGHSVYFDDLKADSSPVGGYPEGSIISMAHYRRRRSQWA